MQRCEKREGKTQTETRYENICLNAQETNRCKRDRREMAISAVRGGIVVVNRDNLSITSYAMFKTNYIFQWRDVTFRS